MKPRIASAVVMALAALALAAPAPPGAGAAAAAEAAAAEDRCGGGSGSGSALLASIPDPGDEDCDGVRTDRQPVDNCPAVRNADQTNTDAGLPGGDEDGDACDADDDADGVPDTSDNCQFDPNPGQEDTDADGYGDACPPVDTDADGHIDDRDNCPRDVNPDQADLDADRRGDVCDADDDGDLVADTSDNCPTAANQTQEDRDGDGKGTACDPDDIRGTDPAPTPGTGPAPPPQSADRRAPRLAVSLRAVLRRTDLRGRMPIPVRCSEACGLDARLTLPAAAARRLRVARTIASGAGQVAGAARTYVFLRAGRRVMRRLGRRSVRATLTVTAVDVAGNRRRVARRVRLVP